MGSPAPAIGPGAPCTPWSRRPPSPHRGPSSRSASAGKQRVTTKPDAAITFFTSSLLHGVVRRADKNSGHEIQRARFAVNKCLTDARHGPELAASAWLQCQPRFARSYRLGELGEYTASGRLSLLAGDLEFSQLHGANPNLKGRSTQRPLALRRIGRS
jgi:hypothetical protein